MALARKTLGIRKNRKEEMRREQIIQAAIDLFSTKGYERATLDDLVRGAGISKSLLYWYWENKAALLSELIDRCMEPYVRLLEEAASARTPFPDSMIRLLWDFTEVFRQNNKLNKLVHFSSLHSAKRPGEDFSQKVNAYYRQVLDLLETLIKRGKESGRVKSETDHEALALLLLSCVEGYIYMSILEKRMPIERALISQLSQYLVPGMLVGPHKKNDTNHSV